MTDAVTWDYTELADAYLKRPDYSGDAINEMLKRAGAAPGHRVCDVGAGVGHLTIELASRKLIVTAVEPNDAMRANGMARLAEFKDVTWHKGTGENTGQNSGAFDGVTFGSSFNVLDRQLALRETARILKPSGWFACMWNHRDLDDPVQSSIEKIIQKNVAAYDYGTRREDQTKIIVESGLFDSVEKIAGRISWNQSVDDCIEAWRSHGTLHRQAGASFQQVVSEIEDYLRSLSSSVISIPYTTQIWLARKVN